MLPKYCENRVLGAICDSCLYYDDGGKLARLCPYITMLKQEYAYEDEHENWIEMTNFVDTGRYREFGTDDPTIPDREIAHTIGIKVDGMTDTEVTAAVDAALATPKPVLPSGIYTTIPDATQIVDLAAALFAEIEKECEDA